VEEKGLNGKCNTELCGYDILFTKILHETAEYKETRK
jgi:hypothetical protein